jgi:hypothetical protein
MGVELSGVGPLIAGGVPSLGSFAVGIARRRVTDAYENLRRTLGGSILVGLEEAKSSAIATCILALRARLRQRSRRA